MDPEAFRKQVKKADYMFLQSAYKLCVLNKHTQIAELTTAIDIIKEQLDDDNKDYIYITADEAIRNRWVIKVSLNDELRSFFDFIDFEEEAYEII